MSAKRHHFVPRFYLRRFTFDGQRLHLFDKVRKETFVSNIDSVASARRFYEIPKEVLDDLAEVEDEIVKEAAQSDDPNAVEDALAQIRDPQLIEKVLGEIEGNFAGVLNGLLRVVDKKGKIKSKYKRPVASFMTVQYLRTQEYRTHMVELYEKASKAFMDMALRVDADHTGEEEISSDSYEVVFDEDYVSVVQARSFLNPEAMQTYVDALCNHFWVVGVNKSSEALYTSDHPIVRYSHIQDPIQSSLGLASPGIEIAFPLTPNHVLILFEKSFFGASKKARKMDGKTISLNGENVRYYNSLQVSQSYRQIFSPLDNFGLAEQMCNENPELSNPDRRRVEVASGLGIY